MNKQEMKLGSKDEEEKAQEQLLAVFSPPPSVTEQEVQLLRSAVSGSLFGDSRVPKA